MTRPVGQVRGVSKNSVGRIGAGKEVFQISRDGMGRARRYPMLTGRVGLGHSDPVRSVITYPTHEKVPVFFPSIFRV